MVARWRCPSSNLLSTFSKLPHAQSQKSLLVSADLTPTSPSLLPCIGCGYDVKGLPPHQPCPECALPIWRSYMGSDLAYAPASYRATLCNGALITAISTLLHILFFAGVCGVVIYFEEVKGIPPPVVTSSWFFPFWFLIPNALGFVGYFLLSTPDPSLTISESRWSARRVLRWTLILQAVGILLQLGISSAGYAANFFPNMPTNQLIGASFQLGAIGLSFLAWIVQLFAAINLCAILTQRVPDESLATWIRSLRWKVPLWAIPGLLLAVGPFVAIGLYVAMLLRLRSRIRALKDPTPTPNP